MSGDFNVTFWGVRGTIPTTQTRNARYGGNTSCVEMRIGDQRLIFDAGTGLYPLGEDATLTDMDIFLSHTHIDHILGFPFFSPAYRQGTAIRLWAGHLKPEGLRLREVLSRIMSPPIFPLTLDFLKADLSFYDFNAGETVQAPHLAAAGITITTLPLHHPDRATGYRVQFGTKSACYITDIEHTRNGLDQALIGFVQDADLLIYDSTFDDKDFDRFIGWGHSTWQQATRIANAANVKSLALFHHDPARTDDQLDTRLIELRTLRPQDHIAHEGLTLTL